MENGELEKNKKILSEEGITLINFNYNNFGLKAIFQGLYAMLILIKLCITKRISHIHSWCTPAGSLGYILSKITGIQLILDSYEPHAEAMVENGTWTKKSFSYKLLFLFEKLQSKRASHLIAVAPGMKHYAEQKYNITFKNNFYTKPACVDFELFSATKFNAHREEGRNKINFTNKIVGVYAGKIGGIYLDNEIFHIIKTASTFWQDNFRMLLLTNASTNDIRSRLHEFDIDPSIVATKFVDHKDIPAYLSLADFALNPVKPVPTKKYCTSIKDGEYWAMGLPVIIPTNISEDSEIIEKNKIGAVLPALNKEAYLGAIKKINTLIYVEDIGLIKDKIISIAQQYRSFSNAEKIYRTIYS